MVIIPFSIPSFKSEIAPYLLSLGAAAGTHGKGGLELGDL